MLQTMDNCVCGRGSEAASAELGIYWLLILFGGVGREYEMNSGGWITKQ